MSENYTPTSRARQLGKNMTPEEKVLWQKLRNRNFRGLKFLRQHPIIYEEISGKPLFFVPDFTVPRKKQ